eukprot:7376936-Prymnesium_polylepis.1
MAIAKSYLGEDADWNGGYVALRLPARMMEADEYKSGYWHHDRCGQRVKCFVFLTAVDASTHPTSVAKGSHRNVYYSYDSFHESRFDDEWVRANYEVADMLGEVGEGFCFDSNTIHRGELRGTGGRDSLIIEFNASEKSQTLDR